MNRSLMKAVHIKTGGYCWYCGIEIHPLDPWQIDHQIPVAAGGTDDLDNLVPACRPCNRLKSDRDPEQFKESLYMTVTDGLERVVERMRKRLNGFVDPVRIEEAVDRIRTLDAEIALAIAPIRFFGESGVPEAEEPINEQEHIPS